MFENKLWNKSTSSIHFSTTVLCWCCSYLMNFRSESLKLKANPNFWQILGREKLFSLILPICNRENGCHSSWYFWQGSQTNNWSLIKLPWFIFSLLQLCSNRQRKRSAADQVSSSNVRLFTNFFTSFYLDFKYICPHELDWWFL